MAKFSLTVSDNSKRSHEFYVGNIYGIRNPAANWSFSLSSGLAGFSTIYFFAYDETKEYLNNLILD